MKNERGRGVLGSMTFLEAFQVGGGRAGDEAGRQCLHQESIFCSEIQKSSQETGISE